jgi:Rieske 2Fe-2S protein
MTALSSTSEAAERNKGSSRVSIQLRRVAPFGPPGARLLNRAVSINQVFKMAPPAVIAERVNWLQSLTLLSQTIQRVAAPIGVRTPRRMTNWGRTDGTTPMDAPTAEFALAGSLAELRAKGRLVVHGGHRPILVVYDRGRVFALDNRCPHMGLTFAASGLRPPLLDCALS